MLAFSFGDHRDTERLDVRCTSEASVLVSDHRGARLCTGGEMQNLHRGKASAVSGSFIIHIGTAIDIITILQI